MSVSDVCPSCGGLLVYDGCRCHLGIRRPQFPAIHHEKDFLFDEERMHYEKENQALRLRVKRLEKGIEEREHLLKSYADIVGAGDALSKALQALKEAEEV